MFRKLIGLGALHVVAAVLILGGQTSVNAAGAATAAIVGTGTISPGLTATTQPQSGTLTGQLTGAGALTSGNFHGKVLGSCNFQFGGSDSYVTGSGNASGSCSGGTQLLGTSSLSCGALSYTRVGALMAITGSCIGTVNGESVVGTAAALLVFAPTSGPTVTSFALTGTAAAFATA